MRVSVVIPCYNAAAYVGVALRSLLNQTRPPDEVIVVDDGSTDGSAAVARSFGAPVRVMRVANGGAARARLRGLAEADGDALMFMDADDLMAPDTLGSLVAVLEDHPEAVATCPWMRYEWLPQSGIWTAAPPSCAPRGPQQDDLSAWLEGWYHPPCTVLWSRAAYERSGGWNPDRAVNQDGEVMMRGFVAGNRLVCSATGTGFYRRLPGEAVSVSGGARSRRGTAARLDVLDGVASGLVARDRLASYAGPLRTAYAAIAQGAPADLAGRAEDAMRALPPPGKAPRGGLLRHPGLRQPPAPPAPRPVPARPAAAQAGGDDAVAAAGQAGSRTTQAVARKAGSEAAQAVATPAPDATAPVADRSGPKDAGTATVPSGPPRADAPAVSVVIPVYNRPALVRRAVESVLSQDFDDLEVIVVDDASTDDTVASLSSISDPRLQVLRQERNQGVAAARNRGIAAARAPLVALLDSDDTWLPDKLTRQVALLRASPDVVGMVHGGVEDVTAEGTRTTLPSARGFLFQRMLVENLLHGCPSNALIRREVFETVGGFDPAYPAIEDYEFWLRICRFYAVDFVPAALCRYFDAEEDAVSGSQAGARRSRQLGANIAGREMLSQRFGHDMRRAGVEHRFALETARRMAAAGGAARLRAARKVMGAARRRPTAWLLYGWLALLMVPPRLRDPVVARLRQGRDRLRSARPAGKAG